MMLIILVFIFVLLLTFTVIVVLTRPSTVERTVEGRVSHIQPGNVYFADDVPEIFKHTRLSEIDWLDNFLQRWNKAHEIRLLITQAESSWGVTTVLVSTLVLAAVGYGVGYYELPNWMTDSVVACAFALGPYLYLRFKRSQRLKRFNQHLPEAIDLISRALRAGHSVTAAIEIVGEECPEPVRTEFREVYRQQNFGLPTREALVQLARRVPSQELQFVVTAMLLQKETGGNLVEILDRTNEVIRQRLRIEGEVRIKTAQGRMTGWILSLLPVVMFFLISLANRSYTRLLIDDPLGRKMVYIGLAMMVIGALIIRKIVNVKV
jgi:tight adherence protein B